MENKRAQVTAFVIIAVLIIAVVVLFLVLRTGKKDVVQIPASLEAPYVNFLSCLDDDSLLGIQLLESQGGYIELPDFEPGSDFMPFSSQLNFVGAQIPYWYYVSGNGIQKEQVPTKQFMERQLEEFIESRIKDCNFDNYYGAGYTVSLGESKARVVIKNQEVEINLAMDLSLSRSEDTSLVREHKIIVNSKLGGLYDSAKKVYEKEQDELFLEEYAVDTLRLYAPVDGVETGCSPLIWNAEEIFDDLGEAIEANTMFIKTKGDKDDYFLVDIDVEHDVHFLNSRNWSNRFEVLPSDGPILMSMPVGNQPGLGILGFCYIPYHFIYNLGYPVLVQVQDEEEIFQFPVAVVLQANNPREPLTASAVEIGIPELCKYKNTLLDVSVYDMRSNFREADVSYDCFGTVCYIGKTENGKLKSAFPQCVNGRVLARSEGYEQGQATVSTTKESRVEIFLSKIYNLEVDLKVDGREYNNNAVISFISNSSSSTVVYPEQKVVGLSQGEYEIQVFIYENSSLNLAGSVSEQCVDVPKSGLGGLIGLTDKKCFEIEIPDQIISSALSGGGKTKTYVVESVLGNSRTLEIDVDSLPRPDSLEQLQANYILFEDNFVEVNFK
ncbi:MAG: hypothetical protein ABIH59_03825 [archaeon]